MLRFVCLFVAHSLKTCFCFVLLLVWLKMVFVRSSVFVFDFLLALCYCSLLLLFPLVELFVAILMWGLVGSFFASFLCSIVF